MTEQAWSKEPWHAGSDAIRGEVCGHVYGTDGEIVVNCAGAGRSKPEMIANAERTAVCVNALAGVEDPEHAIATYEATIRAKAEQTTAQAARIRELENLIRMVFDNNDLARGETLGEKLAEAGFWGRARAVLAKGEESASAPD